MSDREGPWTYGRVHVYTGDGKGKTTAAFGLALRAAGRGLRVYIGQFLKGRDTGEARALRRLEGTITLAQYGVERFARGNGEEQPDDRSLAQAGLEAARQALLSGAYDVVVVDEVNVAVSHGLVPLADVLSLIDDRPPQVELVLTGRDAPAEVIERADLVSHVREVKHYFADEGLLAREGIEY